MKSGPLKLALSFFIFFASGLSFPSTSSPALQQFSQARSIALPLVRQAAIFPTPIPAESTVATPQPAATSSPTSSLPTKSVSSGKANPKSTSISSTSPIIAPATVITGSSSSSPAIQLRGNPLQNKLLFTPASSPAGEYAVSIQNSDPTSAALFSKLAQQPQAVWFGDWNTTIQNDVDQVVSQATAQGQIPVLVSYNIPLRDHCGVYSSGGASSAEAYQNWITQFARGISTRQAIVILEPDALAGLDCLSPDEQSTRYTLLQAAVTTFKQHPNTSVYIDAGHPLWQPISIISQRLTKVGIAQADGFSLNVSNTISSAQNIQYGNQLSQALQGTHYVIDTSRNGNGATADDQTCNPLGRALGTTPTTNTGTQLIDAFLWIKVPGESDGQSATLCNNGPTAGTFWPQYALDLMKNAGW